MHPAKVRRALLPVYRHHFPHANQSNRIHHAVRQFSLFPSVQTQSTNQLSRLPADHNNSRTPRRRQTPHKKTPPTESGRERVISIRYAAGSIPEHCRHFLHRHTAFDCLRRSRCYLRQLTWNFIHGYVRSTRSLTRSTGYQRRTSYRNEQSFFLRSGLGFFGHRRSQLRSRFHRGSFRFHRRPRFRRWFKKLVIVILCRNRLGFDPVCPTI